MATGTGRTTRGAAIAHFVQKYLFSLYFGYYVLIPILQLGWSFRVTGENLPWFISSGGLSHFGEAGQIAVAKASLQDGGVFSVSFLHAANNVFLSFIRAAFNAFTAILLLQLKRPRHPPRSFVHVAVPFFSTFLLIAFNLTHGQGGTAFLPVEMTFDRTPTELLIPMRLASGLLMTAGWGLAACALWYLRRSFAVFVEVRNIVTSGPYRYVRHPMYLSYFFVIGGLLLANLSVAWMLLAVMQLSLMVYRAQLEEEMLASVDENYRRHMERTGFLLPRLTATPLMPAETVDP
jgi:protein-S-isoprenylcysteine O-methyltransferase Ste14